jgi:hypothetical protein
MPSQDELDDFLRRTADESETNPAAAAAATFQATPYAGEVAENVFRSEPLITSEMELRRNYAFGYESSDGSRSEESDDDGNVVGSYTTQGADGNMILVRYRAGPEIGFVIDNMDEVLGKSVPVEDDDVTVVEAAPTRPFRNSPAPVAASAKIAPGSQQPQHQQESQDYEDGIYNPYSFGYEGEEGSRQETSDESGHVKGEYGYTNAEGNRIVVRYRAGPNQGFVIENSNELAASVEKATFDGAVTALKTKTTDTTANTRSRVSTKQSQGHAPAQVFARRPLSQPEPHQQVEDVSADYEDGVHRPYSIQQPQHHQEQEEESQDYEDGIYNPYSFGYKGEEGSRKETGDESGQVKGEYGYTNAEGNRIVVRYRAGPNQGFVVENSDELAASVKKATFDGAITALKTKTNSANTRTGVSTKQSQGHAPDQGFARRPQHQPKPQQQVEDVSVDYDDGAHRPYSFSDATSAYSTRARSNDNGIVVDLDSSSSTLMAHAASLRPPPSVAISATKKKFARPVTQSRTRMLVARARSNDNGASLRPPPSVAIPATKPKFSRPANQSRRRMLVARARSNDNGSSSSTLMAQAASLRPQPSVAIPATKPKFDRPATQSRRRMLVARARSNDNGVVDSASIRPPPSVAIPATKPKFDRPATQSTRRMLVKKVRRSVWMSQ